jgi:hypothetical protein
MNTAKRQREVQAELSHAMVLFRDMAMAFWLIRTCPPAEHLLDSDEGEAKPR